MLRPFACAGAGLRSGNSNAAAEAAEAALLAEAAETGTPQPQKYSWQVPLQQTLGDGQSAGTGLRGHAFNLQMHGRICSTL